MVLSYKPPSNYVFGKVKWFGGYNRKKDCENDFGFLESFDKQDIFVHRKSLKNTQKVNEGDLLLYLTESGKKGINAANVLLLNSNDSEVMEALSETLTNEVQLNFALNDVTLKAFCNRLLSGTLGEAFFKLLTKDSKDIHLVAPIVKNSKYWVELFTDRFTHLTLGEIENLGLTLVNFPKPVLDDRIEEFEKYLKDKSELDRNLIIDGIINHLSISAVLYFIFKNIITSSEQLSNRMENVSQFIRNSVLRKKADVKEFVRTAYNEEFSSFNHYAKHPIISPLISDSIIKRKIFLKDMSFISDLHKNKALIDKAEFYILSKVIPLLSEENKNKFSAIENVVLDEIWIGLVNGNIDLNDDSIFNLFPQCRIMGRVGKAIPLSCEAFHWTPKDTQDDVFLCRGSKCTNPQVLPDSTRNFLEFTVYDWLAHYGVNCESPNKPSKRDFPIKLAGYLNRLKELFSRLHCRCCNTILKPNLSYARDKATVYDAYSGKFELKNIYAAYRVTVFECANDDCQAFSKGIYVTHCLNYKCHGYIDSRDSQVKCDNDRYVCISCNSCCEEHDKNRSIK